MDASTVRCNIDEGTSGAPGGEPTEPEPTDGWDDDEWAYVGPPTSNAIAVKVAAVVLGTLVGSWWLALSTMWMTVWAVAPANLLLLAVLGLGRLRGIAIPRWVFRVAVPMTIWSSFVFGSIFVWAPTSPPDPATLMPSVSLPACRAVDAGTETVPSLPAIDPDTGLPPRRCRDSDGTELGHP